ncbi:E3 ubiquitin-protein like [Actinidia chinensis var. chinensis]|uniref:E3 ubiquitin-protein like n=1 Tax=Actinidia chinensis var. chinensis TaxID=1590841 RepID=A0A2R6QPK9_ACTCC|nr:E3 ubiquitin-protein like [Actinidia chinensis var. chinensis]
MPRVVYRLETVSPPFLTVGGTTAVLPLPDRGDGDAPSSSSSSVIIVIIIISSAIIVSSSIYLLLRCFRRRSFSSTVDDVVSANNNSNNLRDRSRYDQTAPSDDLMENLPVFTFGSVTGNLVGGDCAVCLSKFEPNDQLRLLPLCCHAFHTQCIDAWLLSNQTCPLCRSTVHPTETDVLNKILSASEDQGNGNSFRIEIGSLSRRRTASDFGDGRRSYSIGSFEYVLDDGYEVPVGSTHRRGMSDHGSVDKDSIGEQTAGDSLAAEVAGGRSWLRDYVDRLSSISSRTLSFQSSRRFFTGSSRRNEAVVSAEDLETGRIGEEISELFRWLSGV